MNSQQTIHDMTVTYIEQALSEVKLLHDPLLIEPTLKRFHILRSHARLFGFAPKPRKFRLFVGIKPRAVYTVTDKNGTPLGDPIHEDDLGEQYADVFCQIFLSRMCRKTEPPARLNLSHMRSPASSSALC